MCIRFNYMFSSFFTSTSICGPEMLLIVCSLQSAFSSPAARFFILSNLMGLLTVFSCKKWALQSTWSRRIWPDVSPQTLPQTFPFWHFLSSNFTPPKTVYGKMNAGERSIWRGETSTGGLGERHPHRIKL